MKEELSRHQGTKATGRKPCLFWGFLVSLPWCLLSCGTWTCTASPTLGHDAKQAMRVQGFDIKCTKRF